VDYEHRSYAGEAWSGGCLTPREEQVVRMAAGGLSSKEIARTLGIAKRTVDGHFSDARKRAAAKTRTELVAKFLSQADPDDDLAGVGPLDGIGPSGNSIKAANPARSRSCPEKHHFPDKIASRRSQSTGSAHRGRPTVITPQMIDAIRELRPTHTVKSIAQKLGFSRSTLYVHMDELTDVLPDRATR
jgi:DNA-binding CsgD family transcriptional regulator